MCRKIVSSTELLYYRTMAEGGESKSDRFVKRLDFSAANLATKWKTFKSEFDIHKIVKKYTQRKILQLNSLF